MARKSRGPGRPRLSGDEAPGPLIGLRVSKGLGSRIDRWRRGQDGKPSRTETARQLIERGLALMR